MGIFKDLVERANHVGEQVVQTVILGVPRDEVMTSYDMRDKAEYFIREARSGFMKAEYVFHEHCDALAKDEALTAELREAIYKLLGQQLGSQQLSPLPQLSKTHFKLPSAPSIDGFSSFNTGTALGLLGTGMREDAAIKYIDDIYEYIKAVRLRIVEMSSVIDSIGAVRDALHEEDILLANIGQAYIKASKDKLRATTDILCGIAELCIKEVNEHTAKQYQKLLDKLTALWG